MMTQRRPDVLVIEGDPALSQLLEDLLSVEGYDPFCVFSLSEATYLLQHQPIVAIVAGILTSPFGFQDELHFLHLLREKAQDTPIILITSNPRILKMNPRDLGLYAILPRPFEINDLWDALGRAIRKHGYGTGREGQSRSS